MATMHFYALGKYDENSSIKNQAGTEGGNW